MSQQMDLLIPALLRLRSLLATASEGFQGPGLTQSVYFVCLGLYEVGTACRDTLVLKG